MTSRTRRIATKLVAPLWPVTVAGIGAGAVLGAVVFAPSADHTASTVLRVDAPIDANQIMTGTQPFPDAQPDFLTGEIAYLSSAGFLDAVAETLGSEPPAVLAATQNGKSNLVTISATAPTEDEATTTADAAVTAYTEHSREQTNGRYQAALQAVDAVIPRLEEALRQVVPTPERPTDELVALYLQRTALQVQLERAPGVQVVEPTAVVVSAGLLQSPWLGAVGGGLLGGILGLGAALAWRTRAGILTSPEQLADIPAPVLSPVVPLGGDVDTALARAIYAQLPAPRTGEILVLGATPDSGSAVIARLLAHAAAEQGAVDSVSLAAVSGSDPVAAQADTTVIDGGPLGGSAALTGAADSADQIIVVARVGLDPLSAVGAATHSVPRGDAPVTIVCTRGGVLAGAVSSAGAGKRRR